MFGRRPHPKIERSIHGYTFDDWRKLSGDLLQGVILAAPLAMNRFVRTLQARVLDWLEQVYR